MPSNTLTSVYRRNGKLQSCEPCRKRKQSCDHRVPTCGRCAKRRPLGECYYHPAPLSKAPRVCGGVDITSPDSASIVDPSKASNTKPGVTERNFRHGALYHPRDDHELEIRGDSDETTTPSMGFLGESSASAMVAELISSLGESQAETEHSSAEGSITTLMIKRGAAILAHLRGTEELLRRNPLWFGVGNEYLLFRHVHNIFTTKLWQFLSTDMLELSHEEQMQELSKMVWKNTRTPMHVSGDSTVEVWAQQATGSNLRWETVGLLFIGVGLRLSGVICVEDNDHYRAEHFTEHYPTTMLMLRLANECIKLSRASGALTELLVCLLYKRSVLTEWVRGESSSEAWTRFGEVCSAAVELGLHKEKRVDDHTPFFLCELRIRLFEAIYVHDKYLSTYLGRPPYISYRHSVLQLPSDLSDDEICGSQEALMHAIARLDSVSGYATSGKLNRSATRRAETSHFIVREQILEILLGNPQEDITSRVVDIRLRIEQTAREMPAFVRLDPDELLHTFRLGRPLQIPGRNTPWRPMDVVIILFIHCRLRHTDFLLERALVRRSMADSARLVATAKSLLDLAMKLVVNRDMLHGCSSFIGELLAFYAIPSAAVLATELLKHDQLGTRDAALPRSKTIQQLSVLVSALETIHVHDGNRDMCEVGKLTLQKVLDRLLSDERPSVVQPALQQGEWIDALFPATNDMEFLSWLGDVDFNDMHWLGNE